MRVTNFPHLNHLKEIYLASISSNRCSASSHSKSKIKKPIRKMPKPRIFPRFCKCWNLKKKEKGERNTDIRETKTACTIGPTKEGTILLDRRSLTSFITKIIYRVNSENPGIHPRYYFEISRNSAFIS